MISWGWLVREFFFFWTEWNAEGTRISCLCVRSLLWRYLLQLIFPNSGATIDMIVHSKCILPIFTLHLPIMPTNIMEQEKGCYMHVNINRHDCRFRKRANVKVTSEAGKERTVYRQTAHVAGGIDTNHDIFIWEHNQRAFIGTEDLEAVTEERLFPY